MTEDDAAGCDGCHLLTNVLHDCQDDGLLCTRCRRVAEDEFNAAYAARYEKETAS